MGNTVFPKFTIGQLKPGDWIRTSDGSVGMIHDQLDQPGYRKARIEFPGDRYPVRVISLEAVVEHVTDRKMIVA